MTSESNLIRMIDRCTISLKHARFPKGRSPWQGMVAEVLLVEYMQPLPSHPILQPV